jgi:Spy/CpxP family protein refolding chaperone
MRRSWLVVALIASLCLNVGFCGAWALRSWRHHHRSDLPSELGLSGPTRQQFETNFSDLKRRLSVLHDDLARERGKLMDILASENPSPEAIQAQQSVVLSVQSRIQGLVTADLLKQKELLTPEQQKGFFDHLRRRMDDSKRRPPITEMEKEK